MNRFIRGLAVIAGVLVVCGCTLGGSSVPPGSVGPNASSSATRIKVVATTTVFEDLVTSVGGDRIEATSLVPKGGEVHTFDPRPSDITAVANAQLIVANGLGLDEWLTRLAADSGTKAPVVELADSVPQDRYIVEDGIPNPHLWLDPSAAKLYAGAIAEALTTLDAAGAEAYKANAAAFSDRMTKLLADGRAQVSAVPADSRKIISFHDALPYFARAFGFEIAGVIVKAPGQDPSAAEIAALVDAVRTNHIRVIVSEVQFSDKLAQTLASETGAQVVTDLYDDSLGDPPIDTYEGMIKYDLDKLVAGLSAAN